MEKQGLLDKIASFSSFIKSFFDEYREEWICNKEYTLASFLDEITNDLSKDIIPISLYERISKLIDSLDISSLIQQIQENGNVHDFNLYKGQIENILLNRVFVGKTYYLLKAIGFTNSNVVLIGANGSGKTTFANSIRKELENTDNGIVISAQKMLIFPTYDFIPTYNSAYSTFLNRQKEILDDKQTFRASKSDDIPYDLVKKYGAEMSVLVSALLGERFARRNEYCSTVQTGDIVDTNIFKSTLDEVIDIWNNLIEHRTLFCDNSGNLKIKYFKHDKTKEYPAYQMSDGEREIFYVVGRVLLASSNSLVVVDEPELHLHKAILNKLWDALEQKRNDCMFVYLTHDIDFASTRIAKKCWLKSYTSDLLDEWELEPISDNEIPEGLLMKLLGSRKKILFCEGKENSLDRQIFELLFPNFTITPVTSCKDVINYTKAFNRISNKYAEAFGIIDRDFRTTEQLTKLETENVFAYNVAEIENLFLVEDFIKGFADYKKEKCEISEIKNKIMELFENSIQQQTSFYITQKINFVFNESHIKTGKTKEEVIEKFKDFTSHIQIETWYEERLLELKAIVSKKDYNKAIMVFNNKGLHRVAEKAFGMSSYNKKAIEFLKVSEIAKESLRKLFPQIVRE